jgi:hypothetical protein
VSERKKSVQKKTKIQNKKGKNLFSKQISFSFEGVNKILCFPKKVFFSKKKAFKLFVKKKKNNFSFAPQKSIGNGTPLTVLKAQKIYKLCLYQ